jgi:hypothetical protein
MGKIINNVDLDKIAQTTASGKKDKSTLRKSVRLQGEWILDPASPTSSRLSFLSRTGNRLSK